MKKKNIIDNISIEMLANDPNDIENENSLLKCIKSIDNIDLQGQDGRTLLIHAAVYNYYGIAEYLLHSNANIEAKDSLGNTALHAAVMSHNERIVELLLKSNANVNAVNNYGNTPLFAASHQDINCIALLLDYGANPFLKNEYGVSAYDTFVAYSNIIEIINKKMVDRSRMDFLLKADEIKNIYRAKGNAGCIASNRVTVDGRKIGYMYREEPSPTFPDSGWRFFAGDEDEAYTDDPDNFHIFDLNTICNYDNDIISYLSSDIGSAYIRVNDRFVLDE